MANEDFTTYDETDEGNNVTVIASKVSWIDLDRDESSHVSDSKGAGHFGGDFAHLFECLWENHDLYNVFAYWAIANAQLNFKALLNASADFQAFYFENETYKLATYENGASGDSEVYATPAESTTHYVTITRDDSGGVNNTGQLVALIRTGSHTGNLETTLTVDCSVGEQNDFEFIFGLMSFDDGVAGRNTDGYTQNLDLQEVPPTGIQTYMHHYQQAS